MKDIYLGKNIKSLREKKGLSKEELGRRVGVSGVTIGYWESGKTAPRMGKVEHIAEILGVTVDELLFVDPNMNEVDNLINVLELNINDDQKKAIELVLNLSSEDLKIFTTLMERSISGEN